MLCYSPTWVTVLVSKVSSHSLSLNILTKLSLNKDRFNCNLINKVIIQTTNYPTSCSALNIITQALYVGLYPLVPIVQWYYALQHHIAASCSTAYSTLVLWQLPVALNLVHWGRRTVVQLPVAMYYNCTYGNTFLGHGTTYILTWWPPPGPCCGLYTSMVPPLPCLGSP